MFHASGRSALRCPVVVQKKKPTPTEINYITPAGFKRLADELTFLHSKKRPEVVGALGDAAAEGDRSENAEYIYRKRQLREIDSGCASCPSGSTTCRSSTRPRSRAATASSSAPPSPSRTRTGETATYRIVGVDESRRRRRRHLLEVAGRPRAARQGQGGDGHRPLARRPARADHREDRLPLIVRPGSGVRERARTPD